MFFLLKYMHTSFDKFREKSNLSAITGLSKTGLNLVSISSTAEALALSPAAAKRMSSCSSSNSSSNQVVGIGGSSSARNSTQILNANQILTAVQNNAQKIGKRLNSAFSSSPKNPIRLIEAHQNKNPISVYAGVVVTSSRSSRRRLD